MGDEKLSLLLGRGGWPKVARDVHSGRPLDDRGQGFVCLKPGRGGRSLALVVPAQKQVVSQASGFLDDSLFLFLAARHAEAWAGHLLPG